MLFDIGFGEMFAIGVAALLVLGPDRLPQAAAQAARVLKQLRDMGQQAKQSVVDAAEIDPTLLRDLRELDPRRTVRDLTAPVDDVLRTAKAKPQNAATPPVVDDAGGTAHDDIT